MASFEKFIKGYEDKKESNGYPTKRNHAGNQQNYIPSGEDGGEYTYGGGGGSDEVVETETKTSEKPQETATKVAFGEGDKNKTYKGFEDHINQANFRNDFKDVLKKDFSVGNKEAKADLDWHIANGNISIHRTSRGSYYSWGTVNVSANDMQDALRLQGEVFWHESYHALDFTSLKYLPKEDLVLENSGRTFNGMLNSFFSSSVSTRYKTSNGMTMLDTLTKEITSNKKNGVFNKIGADFKADLDSRVKKKFPDVDVENLSANIEKIKQEISDKVKNEYNITDSWDRYVKERELLGSDERFKKLKEVETERMRIKANDMFKEWGNISDMAVASGYNSFCGGHLNSYFRKDRANKALEFIAEYGSAKATGDKASLDKFKKYFPETSKACEDCIEAIHKYSKGA